ncbi:MAG: hypothetical protein LCH41_08520 [Armatimonadetes bacterium]|nr:hypothetical protein [Armatimonadota bacterium]
MKLNASFKASLIALAVGGALYGGYWGWGEMQVRNFNPAPIQPGRVTMVAMNTDAGFRVQVANAVAQLVQVNESSGGNQRASSQEEGEDARRIPVKELFESLQGDAKALGVLVTRLNRIDDSQITPDLTVWTSEDLQKALAGDPALSQKLREDLNVELDGTPLPEVRLRSLLNGIVIDFPVPLQVPIEGETKTITARVRQIFQPAFAKQVSEVIEKKFQPTQQFIVGNYQELAMKISRGETSKENVKAAIEQIISENRQKSLASKPEQILLGAEVLVNDSMLTKASYRSYKDDKEKELYSLQIGLTDEGRKRMWKYSRNTKGFALLVVVDGIAIAAPRISTELAQSEVSISGLRDKTLVEEAVKAISEVAGTKPASSSD